ncbi:MAG: site-2 protease family protein [Candidatus Thermoplasmatota archaeon]
MEMLWIVLALVAGWALLLYWLGATGRLARWNMGLLMGIALMVRTQRGTGTIEFLSRPKRFWNLVADVGIVVTLLGMAAMTILFVWSALFALQPDSGLEPLGVAEILVIPGVNPFVPLWYGLVALIVTLVVHEGGHGILARANNMRLKSLGLLIAVVPIGAFVEPDEADMKAASRRKRLRVFAAGPAVNLAFASLSLLAFSSLVGAASFAPGVHVAGVVVDGPAADAGVEGGITFVSVGNVTLADWTAFRGYLNTTRPGDVVALAANDGRTFQVTLESRWEQLTPEQQQQVVAQNATLAESLQQQSFLGVRPLLESDVGFLSAPFEQGGIGFLKLISLPIGEIRGSPVLSTYMPAFLEAPATEGAYWIAATLCFWLFWINLMVGLTNILPMAPLDGGHIFRDVVGGAVQRLRPSLDEPRRERVVGRIAAGVGFFILAAFILQIAGPYLARSFG